MIKHFTRNQLDLEKYDACIAKAFNTRIYACSWYLDEVCDDWDVLVEDDYRSVMPLPKRKKAGMYYIYQTPWIQQIGIFSRQDIDELKVEKFINTIPKKFKLVDIFLNSKNEFSDKDIQKRINYILPLDSSFEDVKNDYNKNRKRVSKTDFNSFVLDKKGDKEVFLKLYEEQETSYKTHKDSFSKLQALVGITNSNTYIWNVYKDNILIAGLFWVKDKYRVTYLAPIATSEAKKENIPTYIINELIKEHENSSLILDFEGSMVEGIAQFYRSFGAKTEAYYHFKKINLFAR